MEYVLEAKNLCKYFKFGLRSIAVEALKNVSFSVPKGCIFGLLGANGAGKSTAIKILLGLLKQNSGSVEIFSSKLSSAVKRRMGYLPETPNFYGFLTGLELVSFYARLCGLSGKEAHMRASDALALVGLSDAANRRVSLYSKGMQQRAGLAQAIVHDPELLVLDEPASGLDPVGMADMADIILELKRRGKTILLSSHMLAEVEKLCDEVCILSRGQVAAMGSLDALLNKPDSAVLGISGVSAQNVEKIERYAESLGAKIDEARTGRESLSEFFKSVSKR